MKKRTKIVATISDRNCGVEFIKQLHDEGMDVVRINTAHQSPEQSKALIDNVRAVSERIAILVDTKGPEVRTLSMEDMTVNEGETIYVTGNREKLDRDNTIGVSYQEFVTDIQVGQKILIDDGDIAIDVIEKEDDYLVCRIMNSGTLKGRKSVNTPGASLNLPALNDKDREFVRFSIEQDIDFIAHSFVRSKKDIEEIQSMLNAANSGVKIIAKIENEEGVDNIDEILDNVYGIMVARGDLGIEIPGPKLPAIQKRLVRKCMAARKPVIIATQMLHSMIENPRATRAEINDIANAIYDGTDAVMLSGETAYGKYPVESVKMMASIAQEVELDTREYRNTPMAILSSEVSAYLAKSTVEASVRLKARAIVADSTTGRTIRNLSGYRGSRPLHALCYHKRTMRELALSYGVIADYMEPRESTDDFTRAALQTLIDNKGIELDDMITITAGNFGRPLGASYLEIATVENLLDRHK